MNQSVKRNGGWITPCGLPAFTDYDLAEKVAATPLPKADHEKALLLTVGLIPGKYGMLSRPDRDWLMQKAKEHNLLPRVFKKKKRREAPPVAADRYLDDHTEGAERGLAIWCSQVPALGGTMPVPPARRSW